MEVIGSSNLSQVLESALCSFVRLDRFPKVLLLVHLGFLYLSQEEADSLLIFWLVTIIFCFLANQDNSCDYFKAQINLDVIILEDSATSLAAALMASSVALCNAGIETYDICLASHFWVLFFQSNTCS